MPKRERYEWCNFWWDEDTLNDSPRILLVGDSITSGYRPFVTNLVSPDLRVDMLATSKAVDNPALLRELDYITSWHSYAYETIHFNNGIHGKHLSTEDYAKWYECTLLHLLQGYPEVRLILAHSTPTADNDEMVVERNLSVTTLAAKYGLEIDDLYTPMIGRSELYYDDGVHFTDEGRKLQAKIVADAVRAERRE